MRRRLLTLARDVMLIAIALSSHGVCRAEDEAQRELLATFHREFVPITPGQRDFPAEFTMGRDDGEASEKPAHRVRVDYPLSVARYEVPQNLWQAVMGENPSKWKGPRNSVEQVSWDDCQQFCQRVTKLLRDAKLIAADEEVRLPTEAEWEYFTRASATTRYSFGDEVEQLGDYGWFTGNAAGNDPAVGAKRPNPWQLYDVHGYLSEWCADSWHDDYQGAPVDGSTWTTGGDTKRAVLRGGSWKDAAEKLTSTARQPAEKSLHDDAVGLRCVLATVPPPSK